jgi:chromosome segregation ATPase
MQQIVYHIKVPLKTKDEEFMHIQNLIETKRNSLIKKQKNLRLISNQNHFLEEVQKDYIKYYNFIVEQKRDQIKALELLNTYIADLTKSNNLTKHNIEDATEEQKKIMQEIKSIKNGLDSLLGGFDNMTPPFSKGNSTI